MRRVSLLERPGVRVLIVLGIWTALGLIDASQTFLYHYAREEPIPVWVALGVGVSDWYTWALLTPLIVWLARRVPLERPAARPLLFHMAASLLAALLVIGPGVPIVRSFTALTRQTDPPEVLETLHWLLAHKLIFYVLIYWLILGVTHGILMYNRLREQELQAARLETELAQTQLEMLRMQLHPHFLFNTLHAISALVHKDVDLADRMIARLGELLRSTLDNAGTQEVSLRQELEFIEPYLEIEQARLGPRLSVRLDVDPATLDARVPNLLLQPLVENAVRHGIGPKTSPGVIQIRARRDGGRLTVEVSDTGVGLAGGAPKREGVGLGITRERLRHLYGAAQRLEVRTAPGGGVVVAVSLPFHEDEDWDKMPAGEVAKNGPAGEGSGPRRASAGPPHAITHQDPRRR
jgi:two-component system LytT family sensor kinase